MDTPLPEPIAAHSPAPDRTGMSASSESVLLANDAPVSTEALSFLRDLSVPGAGAFTMRSTGCQLPTPWLPGRVDGRDAELQDAHVSCDAVLSTAPRTGRPAPGVLPVIATGGVAESRLCAQGGLVSGDGRVAVEASDGRVTMEASDSGGTDEPRSSRLRPRRS